MQLVVLLANEAFATEFEAQLFKLPCFIQHGGHPEWLSHKGNETQMINKLH